MLVSNTRVRSSGDTSKLYSQYSRDMIKILALRARTPRTMYDFQRDHTVHSNQNQHRQPNAMFRKYVTCFGMKCQGNRFVHGIARDTYRHVVQIAQLVLNVQPLFPLRLLVRVLLELHVSTESVDESTVTKKIVVYVGDVV